MENDIDTNGLIILFQNVHSLGWEVSEQEDDAGQHVMYDWFYG
jgi:hypothetical protein